ncbi:UNKNOWN [Stylonychia lemnae]|uniref:chitin synthase n=1 Tax=Stylonychia lemnae TaxID=5949 RepID=A0A078AZH0_STYLE|nr:UNKNOWN [Stylonychia lemnae]|eukprot:CDW86208.1 UNKNOWN [Stylonychia lemnae]
MRRTPIYKRLRHDESSIRLNQIKIQRRAIKRHSHSLSEASLIVSSNEKRQSDCTRKKLSTNLTYQTLKLFDYSEKSQDPTDPVKTFDLKFVGIGGKSGQRKIWQKSLLSQIKQKNPDGIKLAIGITMYNESWSLFQRTILGVFQGLLEIYLDMVKINTNISWEEFKNRVIIVLVADGYINLSQDFKDKATELGIFDASAIAPFIKKEDKQVLKEEPMTLFDIKQNNVASIKLEYEDDRYKHNTPILNLIHCFQSCIPLKLFASKLDVDLENFMLNTVNFVFAIKQFNNLKIDSHLYFYRGFCEFLNPDQVFLLDIGTQALSGSISKLVRLLDYGKNIGGACGEIEVEMPQFSVLSCVQFFEYKISHFLDKSFEGCFGYQSVLPGAFSIFRWEAIKGKPLESFFKGLDKQRLGLSELNMFLAEDRIMCFEIVAQNNIQGKEAKYDLIYLPEAVALTDPPELFSILIAQRRRWINGANATFLHMFANYGKFSNSSHSRCRKLLFLLNFVLMALQNLFGFIASGLFYGQVSSLLRYTFDSSNGLDPFRFSNMIENILLIMFQLVVIISFGMGKHINEKIIAIILKIISCFFFLTYGFVIISGLREFFQAEMSILLGIIFILTFVLPMLIFDGIKFCKNFPLYFGSLLLYLTMIPVYLIIFQIYSYSNLHDVSWGNRSASKDKDLMKYQSQVQNKDKQGKSDFEKKKEYKRSRLITFAIWMLSNILAGYILIYFNRSGKESSLFIIAYFLISYQGIKVLGMLYYRFTIYKLNKLIEKDQSQLKPRQYQQEDV